MTAVRLRVVDSVCGSILALHAGTLCEVNATTQRIFSAELEAVMRVAIKGPKKAREVVRPTDEIFDEHAVADIDRKRRR